MSTLPYAIYVSLGGALLALAAGKHSAQAARIVALLSALAGAVFAGLAACEFQPAATPVDLVNVGWITELGVRYHLAADGISLTVVMLTALAAVTGVLFSWNVEHRAGEFFALYLTLIAGVYGVFLSADVFVLFLFYELAIVPKYFLIAIWGSTRREYGAMKLVLYSFAGSALVLAGILWAHAAGGGHSFDLSSLAAQPYTRGESIGLFALFFFGFAVLAGLFPFHTWAPTGHVAAPTAASMLLAGVVMKLGAYGCLRVALPLFPEGFAYWQPVIGWLAVIGIVYAGFVALAQRDLKFVIGYSSVSHMGFVLLGLAAATPRALAGAVLQMFSHGVIAGLLFAVVGRMLYERLHTRDLTALRALPLHRKLPWAAATFVLAGLASMGLPGFSGFPAELSILVGTWAVSPAWTICALLGVVLAAAFTLRAVQASFFGRAGEDAHPAAPGMTTTAPHAAGSHGEHEPIAPITWPEKLGTLLLLGTTIALGLQPGWLLDWILPALQSPAWRALGGTSP